MDHFAEEKILTRLSSARSPTNASEDDCAAPLEGAALQTVSPLQSTWPLTWQNSLNDCVNIRSRPSYVRSRDGLCCVAAATDAHGQRPLVTPDLQLYDLCSPLRRQSCGVR